MVKYRKVFDALATVEQATLLSRSQNRQCRLKKSVLANHIVCLDCGKHFSVLRRQMTDHKMTPEQYRQRWELPARTRWLHPIMQRHDLFGEENWAGSQGFGTDEAGRKAARKTAAGGRGRVNSVGATRHGSNGFSTAPVFATW